jgi:uncharacterized protein (DUF1330 family)
MPSFWIGHAVMQDIAGYKHYAELASVAFRQHPHRVLARGGAFEVLEGRTSFDRHVILEFPSVQAALDCYRSEEYQRASFVRRAASRACELVVVEGL